VAAEQAMEVGANLVALIGLQVVALLTSRLEEVGTLLGVACDPLLVRVQTECADSGQQRLGLTLSRQPPIANQV
jgi:hypothetical protein